MGKWLELAARLEAEEAGDIRDDRDNSSKSAPNVPIVPNVPATLPENVRGGLIRLKSMAVPRSIRAEAWPVVVSNALALARDGWAAKALALGWTALDLFGSVTDPMGDTYSDGLAVWLGGRELRAISATMASVKEGEGWAWFNRRKQVGARLLWELGDGA